MLVEEANAKDEGEGVTHVEIYVTNYTPKNRSMTLMCRIPEAMVARVDPKPTKIAGGFITWNLSTLESSKRTVLSFDLLGLEAGDFDECELFFSKGRGEIVGADPA